MSVFACRYCGTVVKSNPTPDCCPSCDAGTISHTNVFDRIDDVEALFD